MAIGFVIRDRATGLFTLGISERITRIVGRLHVTVGPGSFTIPNDAGTPFFFCPVIDEGAGLRAPPVTQNGFVLSWPSLAGQGNFPNPTQVNFDIVYGYY